MDRVERLECQGLRLQTPFGPVTVARALLAGVVTRPDRTRVTVDELRLEGLRVDWPVAGPAMAGGPWRVDPVAGADGALRAYVTDAAWVLDADVTVPIERGRIDFDRVTVEHVGPDSSMGISRMGAYVDAPNGRTYLVMWSATHVPGAHFERRGPLPGPLMRDRGALELQPFVEALLGGLALAAPAAGARPLLRRTRLGGHVRLGDGRIGHRDLGLVLTGRADGCNLVELSSMPSGDGFAARIADLSAAELRVAHAGRVATAASLRASVALQLKDPAGTPSIEASFATLVLREVVAGPA